MLPDEIKNLSGQVYNTNTFDIEKQSVKRFARAVGDPNPLYSDEDYAGKSRYGGIIAPPGFISSIWFWEDDSGKGGLLDLIFAIAGAGYPSAIDSGIDYEFFQPIKAGDRIKSTLLVKDIRERKSGEETLVFLVTETSYENQNGEQVARVKMTTIHR